MSLRIGVDYQPGSVREDFVPPDELSMPGCSARLMGDKPSRGIVGKVLLEMEPQFSDPFKRMIGHASITERFNWILGEGWYMSVNIGSVSVNPPGCVGNFLHGGSFGDFAEFTTESRPHTGMCNCTRSSSLCVFFLGASRKLPCCCADAWQLRDVGPDDGGFVLIPASHKMLYPIPRPTHTSMDLDAIRHLEVSAGSIVIYFNHLAHGVWGWTGKTERRAVMSKGFTRLYPGAGKL